MNGSSHVQNKHTESHTHTQSHTRTHTHKDAHTVHSCTEQLDIKQWLHLHPRHTRYSELDNIVDTVFTLTTAPWNISVTVMVSMFLTSQRCRLLAVEVL